MFEGYEELPLLHTRRYETRVFRSDAGLKVVGWVQDEKPPGLYVDGDPEPLEIHHMTVVLDVDLATLSITDVDVTMRSHPNDTCPSITGHYRELIGTNVTRGFNRRIRELFGGPRGCSHTTALLQAMGPVVTQSIWSTRVLAAREEGRNPFERNGGGFEETIAINLNTCHIWAEDGETVARIRAGEAGDVPVWIRKRFAELGRDPSEWRGV